MKKIIVSICVIGLMLVSSGVSVNAFDKGELFMELETEGNTLITEFGLNETRINRVIEINSAGSIVWQKAGLSEPMDAERLSNGNTLITEYGDQRVIEINSTGTIKWIKTGLYYPVDAERLSNGNTLIVEANVVDGHTNLKEFKAGSNPRDNNDYPGKISESLIFALTIAFFTIIGTVCGVIAIIKKRKGKT